MTISATTPDLNQGSKLAPWQQMLFMVGWVCLVALFFAQVEIQIEGADGWAASLPTWRIDDGWFVDICWGGRPLTGYHAWVFSFIFLILHVPIFVYGKWNWQIEARIIACIEIFWLVEDFLWFVMNPAFGIRKFTPEYVWWHKRWFLFMPHDYWVFLILTGILLWLGFYGVPLGIKEWFGARFKQDKQ